MANSEAVLALLYRTAKAGKIFICRKLSKAVHPVSNAPVIANVYLRIEMLHNSSLFANNTIARKSNKGDTRHEGNRYC